MGLRNLGGMLLLFAIAMPSTAVGQGTSESDVVSVVVRDSPISGTGTGSADAASITLELGLPAVVSLRIEDFDGRTVRELMDGPREAGTFVRRWSGRDTAGDSVPDGPYRVVATAQIGATVERTEAWITVAEREIYPRRPAFITVVLDPGHGGSRPGAEATDGTREADLDLDIALRAAAMLEGAGVNVVLTRVSDSDANMPQVDRTGDGIADETDELAARNDIANAARADLLIAVHNNIAVNRATGGPSTFYSDERTYSGRSARLARVIQDEMVSALGAFASRDWQPFDHGALRYPYYVLRDFDPPRLRRPTQMPAVLSEGMFLSNPLELQLLQRPEVRQAMAVAYYDAVAGYLDQRTSHIGYELIPGPSHAAAGETATFEVEVRNPGNVTMQRWTLSAGAIPAPLMNEGQGRSGATVGETRIPRLVPGEHVTVMMEVTAPDEPGEWFVILDARDGDGKWLSDLGAPALQVPLTVTGPHSSPDPVPTAPAS